jgi:two-component system, cell cycle response regulator DivK
MATILIVEDDENSWVLLQRMLQFEGFATLIANDGVATLAVARTKLPDLIIMDMGIPIIHGWQVTYRLKQQEATKHIPIIALTAYATPEDRERCFEVGCDEYESKPIDFKKLMQKIRHLLSAAPTAPTE